MPLSDTAVRNAKPSEKPVRLFDGGGLLLTPMLFVCPGELRKDEWTGFDLDKAEWRYMVTKTKTEHLVPLPVQALSILRELHALTVHCRYVFPGRAPQKCMSEAAVNAALRRMG